MRTVRHRKPENFLSSFIRNGHGIVEEAALSPSEAADEALVMGLRLREGLDAAAIADRFGLASVVDWGKVAGLERLGYVERNGSRIAVTASGRLLLDTILGEIAAIEPTASALQDPPVLPPPPAAAHSVAR
jgi:oxygen-independent coproporphyrinogen-3 oxidase